MIKKFFNFYETGEHKIFVIFGIKISVKKKKKNGKTIEDIMNYYDKKINAITNEIKTSNFLLKEIYLEKYNDKTLDADLLGILVNPNYNQVYAEAYKLWYLKYFDNKQLLKLYGIISNRYNIWSVINPNFWIVYIMILHHNNKTEEAEKLLLKYYEKYNLQNIHQSLIVSKIAKNLGLTNENIEKSVFIANKSHENIKNKIFEKLIKGKTIAVVGNGPQEIGKGKGKEIDSYDIVIRFNNFNIESFAEDYGTKTNIWIRNNQTEDVSRKFDIMCCWEIDLDRTLLTNDKIYNEIYNDLNNDNFITSYLDSYMHSRHMKTDYRVPFTSGGIILNYIYHLKKEYNEEFSYKNVYGFSFLNNDLSYNNYHYYKDNLLKSKIEYSLKNWHKINEEILFLRRLFDIEN
ncbi:glycosyltransferase family 29 protein [Brachyspira innocens]|uniref:glycosyltransferase family 29 protein n=1 Tax=Brachyspira innocens TaxID=13264 RepID=UPI0026ECC36D|nr:glycosyltransferase family 29 protein [Brachyspira innocens]